eukprot:TRINITY_DN38597_c0_g1_i2.p1 TRINITY_DN38597_c0_g1~~TRINITY_DN38597_c0_g1_i2.p1  ORF type:complete len:593 (-),score=210.93 TRINITY_DN38597_c0_g1_i2:6-1784(-)
MMASLLLRTVCLVYSIAGVRIDDELQSGDAGEAMLEAAEKLAKTLPFDQQSPATSGDAPSAEAKNASSAAAVSTPAASSAGDARSDETKNASSAPAAESLPAAASTTAAPSDEAAKNASTTPAAAAGVATDAAATAPPFSPEEGRAEGDRFNSSMEKLPGAEDEAPRGGLERDPRDDREAALRKEREVEAARLKWKHTLQAEEKKLRPELTKSFKDLRMAEAKADASGKYLERVIRKAASQAQMSNGMSAGVTFASSGCGKQADPEEPGVPAPPAPPPVPAAVKEANEKLLQLEGAASKLAEERLGKTEARLSNKRKAIDDALKAALAKVASGEKLSDAEAAAELQAAEEKARRDVEEGTAAANAMVVKRQLKAVKDVRLAQEKAAVDVQSAAEKAVEEEKTKVVATMAAKYAERQAEKRIDDVKKTAKAAVDHAALTEQEAQENLRKTAGETLLMARMAKTKERQLIDTAENAATHETSKAKMEAEREVQKAESASHERVVRAQLKAASHREKVRRDLREQQKAADKAHKKSMAEARKQGYENGKMLKRVGTAKLGRLTGEGYEQLLNNAVTTALREHDGGKADPLNPALQ